MRSNFKFLACGVAFLGLVFALFWGATYAMKQWMLSWPVAETISEEYTDVGNSYKGDMPTRYSYKFDNDANVDYYYDVNIYVRSSEYARNPNGTKYLNITMNELALTERVKLNTKDSDALAYINFDLDSNKLEEDQYFHVEIVHADM